MAYPSVSYTFTNGTVADGANVSTNFSNLVSGLSDGTKDLNMNAATFAGNLTANGNIVLGNASSDTVAITGIITLGALSTLTVPVGAAATPSLNFTSSLTTGFSCAAAGTLILSIAGVAVTTTTAGLVTLDGSLTLTGGNKTILFQDIGNYDFSIVHNGGNSLDFKSPENSATAILSLSNAGIISIPFGQIKFPATQNPSIDVNTLDDYEEGTWTPTLGGTATYGANHAGYYTKVGNLVTVRARIYVNAIGTGSTNTCAGLPFTSNASVVMNSALSIGYFSGLVTNIVSLYASIPQNGTTIYFYSATAAQGTLGASAVFQNGALIDISGSYTV